MSADLSIHVILLLFDVTMGLADFQAHFAPKVLEFAQLINLTCAWTEFVQLVLGNV